MAHLPVYMIFDDHDITDDWNLTRGWEEAAYEHPFSRRIIGNALTAYWLCQGWGNKPPQFNQLTANIPQHFKTNGIEEHDKLVDCLLDWSHWHFSITTQPKILVLDTRTHRWRSESSPGKPSGLLDWESLTDMQQELIGEPQVILVSAAPVFGVKMIETIQRIFTFFGKALTVDAENWMAHPGAANVMLNIFRHPRTPPNFIILSGDVHYSFAYDITLRSRNNSPKILQITASGIKNTFPPKLLRVFDILDQFFFRKYSPLHWLTKRRSMRIRRRYPNGDKKHSLYNGSGIGDVTLAQDTDQVQVKLVTAKGKIVTFQREDKSNEDG